MGSNGAFGHPDFRSYGPIIPGEADHPAIDNAVMLAGEVALAVAQNRANDQPPLLAAVSIDDQLYYVTLGIEDTAAGEALVIRPGEEFPWGARDRLLDSFAADFAAHPGIAQSKADLLAPDPVLADLLAQAMVDPHLLMDPAWRREASLRLREES